MEYQDYKEFISIEGLRKQVSISPMTRNEICEKAGINTDTLDPLLSRTRNQLTRIDTIAKLAYALDCKIDDLIEFKGVKFKNTCACYSRMPLNPKPELSYAPLFDMYYDLYGSKFEAKLEKALEKVHAVEVKSLQKTEVKNEAISYRQRINAGKPLTLPALYEICKALKCTPGCVFGCKGKYNYEIEASPLNEIDFTPDVNDKDMKTLVFEEGKEIRVRAIGTGFKRMYINKESLEKNDTNSHLINSLVIYDEQAYNFFKMNTSLLPEKIKMYPLEEIDATKESPFYVNNEWRKSIFVLIDSDAISFWNRYFEKEKYLFERSIIKTVDRVTKVRIRTEDGKLYFRKIEKPHYNIKDFNVINYLRSFPSYYKLERLNPYYKFIKAEEEGRAVKIFSNFYSLYEKTMGLKFLKNESYYIEQVN